MPRTNQRPLAARGRSQTRRAPVRSFPLRAFHLDHNRRQANQHPVKEPITTRPRPAAATHRLTWPDRTRQWFRRDRFPQPMRLTHRLQRTLPRTNYSPERAWPRRHQQVRRPARLWRRTEIRRRRLQRPYNRATINHFKHRHHQQRLSPPAYRAARCRAAIVAPTAAGAFPVWRLARAPAHRLRRAAVAAPPRPPIKARGHRAIPVRRRASGCQASR